MEHGRPPRSQSETMFSPGANRSTLAAPKLENGERASVGPVAPTQTRFGALSAHGHSRAGRVDVVPREVAAAVAGGHHVQRARVRLDRPALGQRGVGRAERGVHDAHAAVPAYAKAAATSAELPLPEASSTRSGITAARGATPTTPPP